MVNHKRANLIKIVVEGWITPQLQVLQGELVEAADHLVENVEILIALILMNDTRFFQQV